ncbi:MAG TPA: ketopantoate reductase family protein [Acidimicrobiales bacterium]
MRLLVYGAGAIGGVMGGRLFQAGHDVTLVARGDHLAALREKGLELVDPERREVLPVPAVGHPSEADLADGDVVVLAMKTQDTAPALRELVVHAPPGINVVCAQNGVENERLALRSFAHVYALNVICPATFLEPGVVVAHSLPLNGLFDLGRYPSGVDATAEAIAEALRSAGFAAEARPDILRWKYRKLMLNLANVALAVCGESPEVGDLIRLLRAEGEAVLAAAGIDMVSVEEDTANREGRITTRDVEGVPRNGGSTWQSLARGTGSVETDYLTGEIVLLGRLHGVPTPASELLQRLAHQAAAERRPPGHLPAAEVLAQLPG